jgi:hypothetical protein
MRPLSALASLTIAATLLTSALFLQPVTKIQAAAAQALALMPARQEAPLRRKLSTSLAQSVQSVQPGTASWRADEISMPQVWHVSALRVSGGITPRAALIAFSSSRSM